jgi:hypothetical protein
MTIERHGIPSRRYALDGTTGTQTLSLPQRGYLLNGSAKTKMSRQLNAKREGHGLAEPGRMLSR